MGTSGTTGVGGASQQQRSSNARKKGRWTGSTSRAYGSAILGAPFWKEGTEIGGFYVGSFQTANGECYKFKCAVPSKLQVHVDEFNRVVPEDEEGAKVIEIDQFAMGNLAGFVMALDDMKANGFTGFKLHDRVWIKCVGEQPATSAGYSPMAMFELDIE